MATKNKNLTLILAPAGSGKTTRIEKYLIKKAREKEFSKRILCITFTNRAAEELQRRIENPMVDIFTIHSFLSRFLKNHQREKNVIDEYYNFYKEDIESEFNKYKEWKDNQDNTKKNSFVYEKLANLINSHGEITSSTQLKLIWLKRGIKYNERVWSNYSLGELSHDDLLKFAEVCFERLPKLRKRLRLLYEEIIIDEYQDTDPSVIKAFYHAVKNSETQFILIGDEMQNIYGASHFPIRKILSEFNLDKTMRINYRSPTEIVKILNEIYNDSSIQQKSHKGESGISPKLFLSDQITEIHKKYSDYILLVPTVREVLYSAPELYEEYIKLPEYKHNNSNNINPTDVINFKKSVDPLMEILNQSHHMLEHFINKKYTLAMSIYMKNKVVKENILKKEILNDFKLLEDFQGLKENTIRDYISLLDSLYLWEKDIEEIERESNKYQSILNISYKDYLDSKENYLNSSTQHGVKGESHKKVIVHLKNSSRNNIYMNDFLKLWSIDTTLNLSKFHRLLKKFNYCPIQKEIKKLEGLWEKGNATAPWHREHEDKIKENIIRFNKAHQSDDFINILAPGQFEPYLTNSNVTNYKKLLIGKALERKINNVALTYKLFYVALSRAQEDLIVVLDKELADKKIVDRFVSLGFRLSEFK